METWVIIASGQSLTQEQVELVRKAREDGRVNGVIAVNNVGIDKAPWADVLVAHDGKWWSHHRKEAMNFTGRKFCRNTLPAIEQFIPSVRSGCNSGYMAMEVAWKIFKAEFIILLGFDMHGTHYFGKHPEPLKNTTKIRFEFHRKQFNNWRGCPVINCSPGSALKNFPFVDIKSVL